MGCPAGRRFGGAGSACSGWSRAPPSWQQEKDVGKDKVYDRRFGRGRGPGGPRPPLPFPHPGRGAIPGRWRPGVSLPRVAPPPAHLPQPSGLAGARRCPTDQPPRRGAKPGRGSPIRARPWERRHFCRRVRPRMPPRRHKCRRSPQAGAPVCDRLSVCEGAKPARMPALRKMRLRRGGIRPRLPTMLKASQHESPPPSRRPGASARLVPSSAARADTFSSRRNGERKGTRS